VSLLTGSQASEELATELDQVVQIELERLTKLFFVRVGDV